MRRVLFLHRDLLIAEVLSQELAQVEGVTVLCATDDVPSGLDKARKADLLVADRACIPAGLSWHQHGPRLPDRLPVLAIVGDPYNLPAADQAVLALQLGARAWIPHDASPAVLHDVLRTLGRGQLWLPPERTAAILARLGQQGGLKAPAVLLTPRERSVLDLLATGKTAQQIADLLFLSPNTVRTHRQSLYRKLGVHSALQAASWLRQARTQHVL